MRAAAHDRLLPPIRRRRAVAQDTFVVRRRAILQADARRRGGREGTLSRRLPSWPSVATGVSARCLPTVRPVRCGAKGAAAPRGRRPRTDGFELCVTAIPIPTASDPLRSTPFGLRTT